MRILLDADLSPSRIGSALRERGHDVRSIAAESDLEGLDDESVLELAARDGRVLVTRNSRDFAPLCRIWAEAGREHAGVILIWSFKSGAFAKIVDAVDTQLAAAPAPEDWRGLTGAV